MDGASAHKTVGSRRDAELFAYLRLVPAGRSALLADEDVTQAAELALKANVRMHRCRVLAVASKQNDLHIVIKFPASLSLKYLVGIVRDASAVAVARFPWVERQECSLPSSIWSARYQLDTLSPADVPAAIAQVCHRVVQPRSTQLAWNDFLREDAATQDDRS